MKEALKPCRSEAVYLAIVGRSAALETLQIEES